MTAETNMTAMRLPVPAAAVPMRASRESEWSDSALVSAALLHVTQPEGTVVARAPGRLDVMGGNADVTGSLVLSLPTAERVCVAVERGGDGQLRLLRTSVGHEGVPEEVSFEGARLVDADGRLVDLPAAEALIGDGASSALRCVFGVMWEMLQRGLVAFPEGGVRIVLASVGGRPGAAGAPAAWTAAAVAALARAWGCQFDATQAALLCQDVLQRWLRSPTGPAEAYNALAGAPHALTQLLCQPCTLVDQTRLPEDVLLVGVDCGVVHPEVELKNRRVWVATQMGHYLIGRIVAHERLVQAGCDGYLARVAVRDYVERFRDRLPTKLRGREFVERFGPLERFHDLLEPEFLYKVRSRTEHHIYENSRAHQFVECLRRAVRLDEAAALSQAGELMYASHWSYGQRCGLGAVEADLLTTLIRTHGRGADIYGAKTSGRGCGGTLVVLMRATDRAETALQGALQAYQQRTGISATRMQGSASGALGAGTRVL